MSRTYRKVEQHDLSYLYWDWCQAGPKQHIGDGWYFYKTLKVWKEPSKKELALAKADGKTLHFYHSSRRHKWYMNQISRKYRSNDRVQKHKVYTAVDYEDVDYDLSPGTKKRKGIWWEIY